MSCGSPHDMDCRDVIEQVYLYLDREMADDSCMQIRQHLEECAPCLREYGLEQEVKALVARTCGCDVAPDGMRERVLGRLRAVRLDIVQVEFRAE